MRIATDLTGYYKLHAKIYDATRWSFLFGRQAILRRIVERCKPTRILEVGCGTGRNLLELAKLLPDARLTGLDLSADMLKIAREKTASYGDRVQFVESRYDAPLGEGYDLVLFSYALTMFNPGWEAALATARQELAAGGALAVVDFHDSSFKWFENWMKMNHVSMEGHLLPEFNRQFEPMDAQVNQAYFGLWRYLTFIGKPRVM